MSATLYKIPAGKHSKFRLPHLYFGKTEWCWRVTLGSGCWTGRQPNHISKIVGVGFAPHHHRESVRLGWMEDSTKDSFSLHWYGYSGGKRFSKFTGVHATAGQPTLVSLAWVAPTTIEGTVQQGLGTTAKASFSTRWSWLSYKLRPYFGGAMVAPSDMQVLVEEIN